MTEEFDPKVYLQQGAWRDVRLGLHRTEELLERLGLGTVKAAVDADELVAAIQKERFARTNRFMLALPRALGRVRLTAVETETLTEHVRAWCASR